MLTVWATKHAEAFGGFQEMVTGHISSQSQQSAELTLAYVLDILKTHQPEFNANILLQGFRDESEESSANKVKEVTGIAKAFVDRMHSFPSS